MNETFAPSAFPRSVRPADLVNNFLRWWQPHVWLYLPAYLALLLALGAACRALAHFITSPEVAFYLWSALALNALVSFCVLCGNEKISLWSHRLRVVLIASIPFAAMLFNASVLAPLDAESEINASVALLVGWSSILCVLFIGARYGDRRLPLSAPLVPGLSLFGLLNSLSVDTLVQICFLLFVAGALYLVVYEQMLNRLERRQKAAALQQSASQPATRQPTFNAGRMHRERRSGFLSRAVVNRAAVGYLAACSVWFAAFLGGAALFYYPVEAILPRVMSAPMGAVRGTAAALLDWRGSSPVMELRGGNYPLSDRVVLNVQMQRSSHPMRSLPVLWRGRVYEKYETSRWVETETRRQTPRLKRGIMTDIPPIFPDLRSGHPILAQARNRRAEYSPRLVRRYQIEAQMQAERPAAAALYFPGDLLSLRAAWRHVEARPNGTFSPGGIFQSSAPYTFRASVKEERLSGLSSARGLSSQELELWRKDTSLQTTLDIAPELRQKLLPIIAQIKSRALARGAKGWSTPYSKASAIRNYLVETCEYSLASPLVPATEDAVVFFLTQSKRGACDMFASSMVLLLRAVDIPARLATGYIEPEEVTGGRVSTGGSTIATNILESETANSTSDSSSARVIYSERDKNGALLSFSFREKDAHAWVEYFIPNAGWLNYDPTAGTRTTSMPLEDQIATFLNLPSVNLRWEVLWLPLSGLLLICAGLAWSIADYKKTTTLPESADDITRAQITQTYQDAVRLLRRRVPASSHLTPHEYEAAVNRAKIAPAAKQEFAALTYLLVGARYSPAAPRITKQELQECLLRLRRALR